MSQPAIDLAHFKTKLEALRAELLASFEGDNDQTDTVQLDQQMMGRLSRMDALQGQQMALEAERRRKRQLVAVEQALQRIADEEYGECYVCGELINPKRLAFDPTATRCIQCASDT